MSLDAAIALMTAMIEVAVWVAGPILLAALVGGVVMGVLQTATQINEASVAFVVKATCVLLVMLGLGTTLTSKAVSYTKTSFSQIADVTR
ncbi:MAG: flagellar biosynthetic protein FliQ [Myxococcota bacterium]